ncbi:MAG: hypothetical protein ACYSU7_11615 [Planctomycetota bacterium]|jgi:hypothetical protein
MTTKRSKRQRLLTFRSGGWVLLLGAVVTILVTAWALGGALHRQRAPLIGDGRNVETYGYDLSTCLVDREQLVAAGMCKDALKALVERWSSSTAGSAASSSSPPIASSA